MLAEELVSAGSPLAFDIPALVQTPPPQQTLASRKRKQAAFAEGSTATPPPDGQSQNAASTNQILSGRAVTQRERRDVSRYPLFLPVPENPVYNTTDGIPHNSLRFRYYPAGITPPGSTLTTRTIESDPRAYRISWEDRSPFLKVARDGLRVLGDKGFRTARGNAPVREGKWYVEVHIEHGGGDRVPDSTRSEGAHVRLGWARREAPLNAPVGLDGFSYGYRDKTGEKVTLSRPRPYGTSFRSGDVVGMYISLPPRRQPAKKDVHDPAHIKRERIPIDFKGQEYFETLEYQQSKEMMALMDAQSAKPNTSASLPSTSKKSGATVKNISDRTRGKDNTSNEPVLRPLPTLGGSRVAFFVNGVSQGVAFQDLYDYIPLRSAAAASQKKAKRRKDGTHEHTPNPFDDGHLGYYPTISLFNDARIALNPGPEFAFPPPPDIDAALDGTEAEADGMAVDGGGMGAEGGRTWRPLCERYGEFMAEQWALDAADEAAAREAAARGEGPGPALYREDDGEWAEAERKKQERLAKRRAQAAARKKRKGPGGTPAPKDTPTKGTPRAYSPAETHSPAPTTPSRMYSPAPTTPSRAYSPAPTASSGRSGYNSEADAQGESEDDAEGEMVFEEEGEMEDAPPRAPDEGVDEFEALMAEVDEDEEQHAVLPPRSGPLNLEEWYPKEFL